MSAPRLVEDGALGLLLLAALVVAAQLIRLLATRRSLRSRESRVVVPSSDFDPALEEITRFALQLTRTQRPRAAGLDRRAGAVRIRMDSVGFGSMSYSVEAPKRALPVLQAAGYEQTRLVRPEEVPALPGMRRASEQAREALRRGENRPEEES